LSSQRLQRGSGAVPVSLQYTTQALKIELISLHSFILLHKFRYEICISGHYLLHLKLWVV